VRGLALGDLHPDRLGAHHARRRDDVTPLVEQQRLAGDQPREPPHERVDRPGLGKRLHEVVLRRDGPPQRLQCPPGARRLDEVGQLRP
jgi:hypothetical protein